MYHCAHNCYWRLATGDRHRHSINSVILLCRIEEKLQVIVIVVALININDNKVKSGPLATSVVAGRRGLNVRLHGWVVMLSPVALWWSFVVCVVVDAVWVRGCRASGVS